VYAWCIILEFACVRASCVCESSTFMHDEHRVVGMR
jgi:hypothetical protein